LEEFGQHAVGGGHPRKRGQYQVARELSFDKGPDSAPRARVDGSGKDSHPERDRGRLTLGHAVKHGLAFDIGHATIFAVLEIIEQRRELPAVEERGRAQNKAEGPRKAERLSWLQEHGGLHFDLRLSTLDRPFELYLRATRL